MHNKTIKDVVMEFLAQISSYTIKAPSIGKQEPNYLFGAMS
jgi:hypothetical protein